MFCVPSSRTPAVSSQVTWKTDLPTLIGTCPRTACRVIAVRRRWSASDSVHPAGDHTIFIGRVLAHGSSDRTPMIWGKGQLAVPAWENSMSLRVLDVLAGFGWWGQHLLPRFVTRWGSMSSACVRRNLTHRTMKASPCQSGYAAVLSMKQLPISCLGERGQARSCPKAKAAFSLGSLQVHG